MERFLLLNTFSSENDVSIAHLGNVQQGAGFETKYSYLQTMHPDH